MFRQDILYTIFLGTSIIAGSIVRKCRGDTKRFICLFLGLSSAIIICGFEIWHAFLLIGGFVIFYSLFTFRFIHYAVFLWGFSYLIFFHTAHFYGFSKPAPITQVFHLFLTLKIIGVSFELYDTWVIINKVKSDKNSHLSPNSSNLLLKYKGIITTPYDIVCYAFCYVGMLTGPYYSYRTFNDMLNGWPSKAPSLSSGPFLRRLQEAPFFGFAYLAGSYFVSFDYLRDPAFQEAGLISRLAYIASVFFVYRMRLYFAWVMAECVCMSVGLGAYPALSRPAVGEGPTDLEALDRWLSQFEPKGDGGSHHNSEHYRYYASNANSSKSTGFDEPVVIESKSHFYNYSTIQAVSIWKCEFSPSVRESFRAYNQTLYYWMDNYVYRRCAGPWIVRSTAALLINSLWYGIYPAYFIAHLTLPLISLAEDGMATVIAFFGFSIPPGGLAFLRWFFQMRSLDYLAAGWILLSIQDAWEMWSSFGYFPQVIGIVLGLAHFTMGRFVSAYERWTVENPEADVAEATARNLSITGKAWEPPVIDTYV